MRSYLLALSFLTIMPVRTEGTADGKQMDRTLYFYPVVGATLGLILAAVSWLANYIQLGIAGDALTVIALLALTGGLHMDGLMDTADGILSGRERERKLEIMKDSRVGAMGVAACVSVLLLKVTLLSIVPHPLKLNILILAPLVARWSFVYGIIKFPYARSNPGLGSIFAKGEGKTVLIVTTLLTLGTGILLLRFQGALIVCGGVIFAVFLMKGLSRILGGLTGDTYGATGELTETWIFLLAAIICRVV